MSQSRQCCRGDELQEILAAFDVLDDCEREALTLRYGLNGNAPMDVFDVGVVFGVKAYKAKQIIRSATAKLSEALSFNVNVALRRASGELFGAARDEYEPTADEIRAEAEAIRGTWDATRWSEYETPVEVREYRRPKMAGKR